MVNFIKRRLQVFVSSTYEDLKVERQAAVEAILKAGHIPAGMELFTAGDQSQMEVIKQWIDESDIYLLILGGRYGSIDEDSGKSYTHLEYEYALKEGKPLFACVINEDALEDKNRAEGSSVLERKHPIKLDEFRELALSKMSSFWSDTKDIKIAVNETLQDFDRDDYLIGWVRPTEQADMQAVTNEMTRLSKENDELRKQIGNTAKPYIAGLSFEQMKEFLSKKGVLEYFTSSANRFVDGVRMSMTQNLLELKNVGLIELKDTGHLKFTDDGAKFHNLLQFEALANHANSKRVE